MNAPWVRVQFGPNTAIAWLGDLGQVLVPLGKKKWNVAAFWCAKLVISILTALKKGGAALSPTLESRKNETKGGCGLPKVTQRGGGAAKIWPCSPDSRGLGCHIVLLWPHIFTAVKWDSQV